MPNGKNIAYGVLFTALIAGAARLGMNVKSEGIHTLFFQIANRDKFETQDGTVVFFNQCDTLNSVSRRVKGEEECKLESSFNLTFSLDGETTSFFHDANGLFLNGQPYSNDMPTESEALGFTDRSKAMLKKQEEQGQPDWVDQGKYFEIAPFSAAVGMNFRIQIALKRADLPTEARRNLGSGQCENGKECCNPLTGNCGGKTTGCLACRAPSYCACKLGGRGGNGNGNGGGSNPSRTGAIEWCYGSDGVAMGPVRGRGFPPASQSSNYYCTSNCNRIPRRTLGAGVPTDQSSQVNPGRGFCRMSEGPFALTVPFCHYQTREKISCYGRGCQNVPIPPWVDADYDDICGSTAPRKGPNYYKRYKIGRGWSSGMSVARTGNPKNGACHCSCSGMCTGMWSHALRIAIIATLFMPGKGLKFLGMIGQFLFNQAAWRFLNWAAFRWPTYMDACRQMAKFSDYCRSRTCDTTLAHFRKHCVGGHGTAENCLPYQS